MIRSCLDDRNGSASMNNTSARCRTRSAKPVSISLSVLALISKTCNPRMRAACWMSLSLSAASGNFGFVSTAITTAWGSRAWSNPTRGPALDWGGRPQPRDQLLHIATDFRAVGAHLGELGLGDEVGKPALEARP